MQVAKEDGELLVRALRHYAAWLQETFLQGRFRRRNSQGVSATEDRLRRTEARANQLAAQLAAQIKGSPP